MNVQHAPTEVTESHERHSAARLQGRWLLLARVGWVGLVGVTLAIFFVSLPVYLAQLQTPCAGTACGYQQLTHSQVETLKGIGMPLGDYTAYTAALALANMILCLVVSTLIVWHRSNDRMAMLVALMLVTLGPISVTATFPPSSPSPWLVPNICLSFLFQALFLLVFSLFPTGQFVPRWTRWIVVVFLAVQVPANFFADVPLIGNTLAGQLGWIVTVGELMTLALVQLYRYRRVSNSLQRQQTKWVVFGIAVPITVIVIVTGQSLLFPALTEHSSLYLLAYNESGFLLALFLPLAFGFAMLRYRLWEIDTIINRTLVYGALTLILTGVYVGLVIGLQALLRGIISQDNSVAIVLSTLAIYVMFQPLRRRIQRIIDRRFYRSKYDAAKIVAAFSDTLRQEVDLDQLREHLLAVVQQSMQPTHVSLWLRPPERDGTQRSPWSDTLPVSSEGK
jgi:hypothetical protein